MDPALRRSCYRILWVIALAALTGRVGSIERVHEPSLHKGPEPNAPTRSWPANRPEPMPTFSSNDRSRWATIRAIVEDGTFVIGKRNTFADGTYMDVGRVFQPGYESVDKVLDPKTQQFYSSKPSLLTMMFSQPYWVFHALGFNLDTHRWLIVRIMVWIANVLPLAIMLWLLVGVLERHGGTDWGRLFSYAAACFGTFLGTFAISLNNHIPAAFTAFLAVYPFLVMDKPWTWRALAGSGFWAGLTTCFELPAAALMGGLLVGLLMHAPLKTLLAFVPMAVFPIGAQLALNYMATGEIIPIYAKLGEENSWYDYPGSHWRREPGEIKRGIDWAADYESRGTYAFHLLLGHHGVFSLTPIWLLSFAAMLIAPFRAGDNRPECETTVRKLLFLFLLVSFAVIVFYAGVTRTANYGGWTSGARWFFWLAPLWLIALLPAADYLAPRRWGRCVALAFLAVSVFSASYPAWNPWRHPWLYNFLETMGQIPFGR